MQVTVCLRPEDIRVRDIDLQVPNRLDAVISEIDFLGSFCRATLRLPSLPDAEFLGDFSINLMRDYQLRRGKTLTIALPPDRLRLFARR